MSIQTISITHKNAPVGVREMFSLTADQQKNVIRNLVDAEGIDESCIVSTCNRTEVYVKASDEGRGRVFDEMKNILIQEAGAEEEESVSDYLRLYTGSKAVHHLFQVTAGLDSMLIGEDQILGQVKDAFAQAREQKTTGVYLNTLFRDAVTAAKKVKTDTDISKSGSSTATLAIRAAEEALGTLKNKKVLLIGATGEIGNVVLMNLQSFEGIDIIATTRGNKAIPTKHGRNKYTAVNYQDRYEYIDGADAIISATSSPHYTLTFSNIKKSIDRQKKRAFIDLAVPMDIESKVQELPDTSYYNIDDFERIARENNARKKDSVVEAADIVEEYALAYERWMVFQKSLPIMEKTREAFLKRAEVKNPRNALDHLFYWVREHNTPEDLETFFACLDHEIIQDIK